jgi:hypothetical protein
MENQEELQQYNGIDPETRERDEKGRYKYEIDGCTVWAFSIEEAEDLVFTYIQPNGVRDDGHTH